MKKINIPEEHGCWYVIYNSFCTRYRLLPHFSCSINTKENSYISISEDGLLLISRITFDRSVSCCTGNEAVGGGQSSTREQHRHRLLYVSPILGATA
jgi:hypothetical protein